MRASRVAGVAFLVCGVCASGVAYGDDTSSPDATVTDYRAQVDNNTNTCTVRDRPPGGVADSESMIWARRRCAEAMYPRRAVEFTATGTGAFFGWYGGDGGGAVYGPMANVGLTYEIPLLLPTLELIGHAEDKQLFVYGPPGSGTFMLDVIFGVGGTVAGLQAIRPTEDEDPSIEFTYGAVAQLGVAFGIGWTEDSSEIRRAQLVVIGLGGYQRSASGGGALAGGTLGVRVDL